MVYDFINDETGEVIQRSFAITDDLPKKIVEDGVEYRRDYGAKRIPAIHIPLHWGDGNNPIRFNRGPSGKKHLW